MNEKSLPVGIPYTLVTREQWGASPPMYLGQKQRYPVPYVVLTYGTGTKQCETDDECSAIMRELQKRHMEEDKFRDIGYNFVIGGNGKVYEGRGWTLQPESKMYPEKNGKRLDIAFLGNCERHDISDIMFETSMYLLNYASNNRYIEEEWHTTEIPGGDEVEQCHVGEDEDGGNA